MFIMLKRALIRESEWEKCFNFSKLPNHLPELSQLSDLWIERFTVHARMYECITQLSDFANLFITGDEMSERISQSQLFIQNGNCFFFKFFGNYVIRHFYRHAVDQIREEGKKSTFHLKICFKNQLAYYTDWMRCRWWRMNWMNCVFVDQLLQPR